eukprot:TRINITY_DN869_c2_g1_i1.p1 TRINITY_DN869_c2_g1~~TRINITY_DN869_c2_g1_i1.p1  ORF type:complete len:412 (+),score=131.78 TRINITY_DN869_c2_g1_i1:64-1299(+)
MSRKSKRVQENEKQKKNEKKKKVDFTDGPLGLQWDEDDTILFCTSDEIKITSKIASFDMDSTLISVKSSSKFPKNRDDWEFWDESVPQKLKELKEKGFTIVIFSNQAGIEKNKQHPDDLKGKIFDICESIGFPVFAFLASATDVNRKPNPTMWDYFVKNVVGEDIKIDMKESFYCGDAAGRIKDWKPKAKKDFSCSDRKFAKNVGIKFYTPEETFLGEERISKDLWTWDSIDPRKIFEKYPENGKRCEEPVTSDKQELILFVGSPAAGKSTFFRKHFEPKGYSWVNRDTLKTQAKCLKTATDEIKKGKSVVIDNTNPESKTRAEYIKLAEKNEIPVRCFYFDTPREIADHMNFFREKLIGTRRVPAIGFNMFKSKFEEPSTDEGIDEIIIVKWFPHFDKEEHKKLFLQFTE